jgi:ribosome maturation factor RimP
VHIIRLSLNVGWAEVSSPFFLGEWFARQGRKVLEGLVQQHMGMAAGAESASSATEATGVVGVPVSRGLSAVERTVTGLGFDLVDVERSGRGLLRVFIDRVPGHVYPQAQGGGEFVTIDDCEVVSRQLQYLLQVEGFDYERLEVSSPGLDRPLKKAADYERFAGQAIDLALKLPFQGRRHWKGVLQPGQTPLEWRLVLDAKHVGQAGNELAFSLDEVREARLVPVVDFKRQKAADKAAPGAQEA